MSARCMALVSWLSALSANYVDNNISVYLIDMQNQLDNIPQFSAEEQNQMGNALQVIPKFRQGLTAFINEIYQLVGRKIS